MIQKSEVRTDRAGFPDIFAMTAHMFPEYVQRYANQNAADEAGAESEDDDDMSSVASFEDDEDEEPAGQMDDV